MLARVPIIMKRALLLLAVLTAGCDTSGIEARPGRFSASLAGAINTEVEGDAGFSFQNCSNLYLTVNQGGSADAGGFFIADRCSTSERSPGPIEGTFEVNAPPQTGYSVAYRVSDNGPYYRAVSGTVEIVDRGRSTARGRFSVEAKPVELGEIVPGAESLFITGEFDATGFSMLD